MRQQQTVVGWGLIVGLGLLAVLLLGAVFSGGGTSRSMDLLIPAGHLPGHSAVHKYGRTTNVDSVGASDVWDRAHATLGDQDIWVAPTQARQHTIVSTSTDDDGSPAGTGAHTIRIYCLPTWSTPEASEDIVMDGTSGVLTTGDCATAVIIHRKKVLTKGASGPNVGTITATAATDGTVTAQMNPGEGQTQMAIYGVPSGSSLYLTTVLSGVQAKSAAAVRTDFVLLWNPEPDSELTAFLRKSTLPIPADGSPTPIQYSPYRRFDGPGILKMQATATANDTDVTAEFFGVLVR